MSWDRPNCRSSLERKGMASIVIAAMDHFLVVGLTYLYQIMQTQVSVAALSATPISSHQDNIAHSSQVPTDSLLQITRCLDSSSDKTPRLFTVLYFSVRLSRSSALCYGLPILHECQNYLGGRGCLGVIPDARPLGTLAVNNGKTRCI